MLKKVSRPERIIYYSSLVASFIGVVFIILGIIGNNLDPKTSLYKIQQAFSWRYIGLIIIAAALITSLVCLCVNAKKVDRIADRESRRKQRLSAMMSDLDKKEDTIVINEGKIVESNKPVEEKEEEVKLEPTNIEVK